MLKFTALPAHAGVCALGELLFLFCALTSFAANVNLTMTVRGSGTTNPSAGVSSVVSGQAVPITAAPSAGCRFLRWTGSSSVTFANPNSASTTAALTAAGTVTAVFAAVENSLFSWGCSSDGQLGHSTKAEVCVPAQLPGTHAFTDVAPGNIHTLGLKSDGTVWAWGSDCFGQLGDGLSADREAPAMVSGLSRISQISAGCYHSLALKNDGTVWGWGWNLYGQMGDSSTANKRTPVQIPGLSDVSRISAGGAHNLALKSDGTVWAWGNNNYGQLGDGTTTNRSAPAQISGLSGVAQISAGDSHNLVLKTDGTVWGWGSNSMGLLGDGTTTNRLAPVQISSLTKVSQVSAGSNHSLVLKTDGTVWAFGYNYQGLLGDGNSTSIQSTPVQSLVSGVIQVAAYAEHSMALKTDGTVWAWGKNHLGQLGNGAVSSYNATPAAVSSWTSVSFIGVGGDAMSSFAGSAAEALIMAVNGSGTTEPAAGSHSVVYGETQNISAAPEAGWQFTSWAVSGGASVADSALASTTAVLSANGTVTANFINLSPSLTITVSGNGTTTPAAGAVTAAYGEPQSVSASAAEGWRFVSWSAGGGATVADSSIASTTAVLTADGTVTANFLETPSLILAVSGNGTTVPPAGSLTVTAGQPRAISATPAENWRFDSWSVSGDAVVADLSSVSTTVTVTELGSATARFVKTSQTLTMAVNCAGGTVTPSAGVVSVNRKEAFPISASPLAGYRFLRWMGSNAVFADPNAASTTVSMQADGTATAVFVRISGKATAWGYNYYGQLGNGSTSSNANSRPLNVSGGAVFKDISCAANQTCAMSSDGYVYTWGGTVTQPAQVASLFGITQIAAGYGHFLTLRDDFTIWVWGDNGSGQLGRGNTTSISVPAMMRYILYNTQIAAGKYHSLNLTVDGDVYGFGSNDCGQLGDGYIGSSYSSSYPMPVSNLSDVSRIAAGANHSLALKSDGTVWTWGYNNYGQLGDGTTVNKGAPVQVSGLSSVSQIAGGESHSLALKTDGTVWAWGYNNYGQLGIGSQTNQSAPAQVSGLSGVIQVACGKNHSLALKADGTAWACGDNTYGQLGDGSTTRRLSFVQISGLGPVSEIQSGPCADHSCAIVESVTLTMGSAANGSTTPAAGEWPLAKNVPMTVTATPAANYQLTAWTVSGGATVANSAAASTTVTLSAAGSLTPSFSRITRTLTVNYTGGLGSVSPSGSVTVNQGEPVAITATPGTNYRFVNWTVSGGATVAASTSASTTVTLSYNGSATASFELIPRQITMAASGSGTVNPSAGTVRTVYQGQSLSISATPAANWRFTGWTSTGNTTFGNAASSSTYVVPSGGDSTVTANFEKIQRTLTMSVSPGSSGSVTPSSGTVNQGEAVSITATPVANCRFVSWTVSGGAVVADSGFASTTATLSADGSVTANFAKALRTLTMASLGVGGLNPSEGTHQVNHGEAVSITATGAWGNVFVRWTASGGASVADVFSASTTATLLADGTVTATFTAPTTTLTMAVTPGSSGVTVPPAGAYYVVPGESQTISATPAENYQFSCWTVSGDVTVADTGSAITSASLTTSGSITANFDPLVRLTMAVSGDGAATPDSGVSVVVAGWPLAITATPAEGSRFIRWLGDSGSSFANPNASSTTVTLSNDSTVTAVLMKNANVLLGLGTLPLFSYVQSYPIKANALPNTLSVSSGHDFSLALNSDGILWSWGYNNAGQLGDGTRLDKSLAVQVSSLSNIVQAACGASHAVALKNDGTVWAWGVNSSGQLGDGTTVSKSAPVHVTSLCDVAYIACGQECSLAVKNDGTVWNWGYSYVFNSNLPVLVSGLSDVVQLAAGYQFCLALKNDGTVWAWGANGAGQLGDGGFSSKSTPEKVLIIDRISKIACGSSTALALRSDGTVWAWGSGWTGQLGNRTETNYGIPDKVAGLNNIIDITSGSMHCLALGKDGSVLFWGSGYTGDGVSRDGVTTPRQISFIPAASCIAAGHYNSWFGCPSVPSVNLTVTIDDASHGEITPLPGEYIMDQFSEVNLSAIPASDWLFNSWTISGVGNTTSTNDLSDLSKKKLVLRSDSHVVGQFVEARHNLDISVIGEGTTSPAVGSVLVDHNVSRAISATPAAGWKFISWSASGGATVTSSSSASTSVKLTAAGAITATFERIVYRGMTISSAGAGTTTPAAGSYQVPNGQLQSINAVPSANWIFVSWTISGEASLLYSASAATNYVSFISDGAVTANFTKITRNLTMAVSGSGTTSPVAGTTVVNQGEPQSITAVPAENFAFARWTAGSGAYFSDTNSASTDVTLTQNATVTAVFEDSTPKTLTMVVKGGGEVSPAAGSHTVNYKEAQSISAEPVENCDFVRWAGTDGAEIEDAYAASTSVRLSKNATVTAFFRWREGGVFIWGYNNKGQLGDGTTVSKVSPVYNPNVTGVTQAAIGGHFASGNFMIGLRYDGTVWAWGWNGYGQLGDGTTTDRATPAQISGLSGITQVAAGYDFALALKNDGTVWTWGHNNYGQLGDGTTTDRATPSQIQTLSGVSFIACGFYHALAVKSDGTARAWGRNNYGQLGNNSTTDSSSPVQVSGLTGARQVSGGGYHSMALKADGTVAAWGNNGMGQFGNGGSSDSYVPVGISGLSGVTQVCCGYTYSLALRSDGTVWAGGGGIYHETMITQVSDVQRIAAGYYFSLALKKDGSLWSAGQSVSSCISGVIDFSNLYSPSRVSRINEFNYIVSGIGSWNIFAGANLKPNVSMTVVSNGSGGTVSPSGTQTVNCNEPQLISASPAEGSVFVGWNCDTGSFVDSLRSSSTLATPLFDTEITGLFSGRENPLYAWGKNDSGQLCSGSLENCLSPALSAYPDLIQVAAAATYTLGLRSDGTVWACGSNQYGQLGDGTTEDSSCAVQTLNLTNISQIRAGDQHGLALRSDGTVWAWGCNSSGQLGDGTTTQRSAPAQVTALSGVTQIDAGKSHNLALRSDGTLWAWGYNYEGQLGNGTTTSSSSPVQVSGLTDVAQIVCGGYHNLALKSDGTVFAWGYNNDGQLGNGGTSNASSPVRISSLSGVTRVAAGGFFSFALKADGTVYAWGWNHTGQLGVGSSATNYSSPVLISSLSGVTSVAGGSYHALALKNDGTVWCWGQNNYGQVGTGTTSNSTSPVNISSLSNMRWIAAGPSAESSFASKNFARASLTMAVSGQGTVTPSGGAVAFPGDPVSISASPAENWRFSSWTVSGGAAVADSASASTSATLSASGVVTANFTRIQRTLTMGISPPNSGTVTPTSRSVNHGEAVAITATAAANYQFNGWGVSGGATVADSASASSSVTLTADGSVTASFVKIQRTLTMGISPANSGYVTPSSGAVNQGEAVSIAATAAANYQFSGWTASGGATVADNTKASTTATLTAAGAVTANFTKIQRALTMGVSPANSGSVTPSTGLVNQSEAVAITATAAANYQFSSWSATGGAIVANNTSASTTATLTADGSVTASFVKIQRTLTMGVSPANSGSVTPSTGAVNQGEAVAISATAAANYQFSGWGATGGATVTDNTKSSTTATLTANGTVTANFTKIQRILTMGVSPANSGSVTPSNGLVNQGEAVAITATAAANYQFSSWSVTGGATVANNTSASTTATLTANGAVTANFTKIHWTLAMGVSPANSGSVTPSSGLVNHGEAVAITATAAANYQFSGWTVSGGAAVANNTGASTTVTLAADGAVTAVFKRRAAVLNDFDGDGKSDLLFQHEGGTIIMYFMNGTSLREWSVVSLGAGQSPVATGDFNGDGCCDILTRDTGSGDIRVFLMRGASVLSSGVLLSGAPDWRVAATCDLNGDGKTDIVWRHETNGVVVGYIMDGLSYSGCGIIYDGSDPAWRVVGAGDLDGDGKADIVWRHANGGQVLGYLMNGLSMRSCGIIYDGSDPAWRVVGICDLNGDGKADIVWRHSSAGVIIAYLMSGLSMTSWGVIYDGANPNMMPAGLGDFSGVGKSGVALRDSLSGNVLICLLDGISVTARGWVYSADDPRWTLTGLGESLITTLTMGVSGAGSVTPPAGARAVPVGVAQKITATASPGWKFNGWTVSGDAVIAAPSAASTELTLEGRAAVTAKFTVSAEASTGDFNGDGKADILWRNTANGWVAQWLMSGGRTLDARVIFDSDKAWAPVAKGDFNGDGIADILWTHAPTGAAVVWYMSGGVMAGCGVIRGSSSSMIVCAGDFNGDGKADILWRNGAGAVSLSLMNGSTVLSEGGIFGGGSDWAPVLAADFNGDGKADILWRETKTGAVAVWLMSGLAILDSRLIFAGDGDWAPVLAADFNNDGKADIIWRRASDAASVVWLMSGFTMQSCGYIHDGWDTSWRIVDAGDYDGDGKVDILWRHCVTGQTALCLMDGLSVRAWIVIFDGDPSWTVVR